MTEVTRMRWLIFQDLQMIWLFPAGVRSESAFSRQKHSQKAPFPDRNTVRKCLFTAETQSESAFSQQKPGLRAADNDKMHTMFFLDIVYWLWQYNSMAFFDADRVLRCVISLEQSCLLFYKFVRFNF